MNNPFAALAKLAHQGNLCIEPGCMACGNVQFRSELARMSGPDGELLADALRGLAPVQIMTLPSWQNCLCLAFEKLSSSQQERVLSSWAILLHDETQFAQAVLSGSAASTSEWNITAKMWIERCVDLAFLSSDEQLAESLLKLLGPGAAWYPKLVALSPTSVVSPQGRKREHIQSRRAKRHAMAR